MPHVIALVDDLLSSQPRAGAFILRRAASELVAQAEHPRPEEPVP
jgi:hypothetical protein